MNVLQRPVLVLNRSWQPVEETTVQTALCDLCRGAKKCIDTEFMIAMDWEAWIKLSVRPQDEAIRTVHGSVRVPTVTVVSWPGMPNKKPKKNRRGVGARDRYVCAYSGEFAPDGNVDHVVPRGQGGTEEWTNLVWAKREINHRKGNRTPAEAGLRLRITPTEPKSLPALMLITPKHRDWELFMVR